jgi:putative cell wall-binding protein
MRLANRLRGPALLLGASVLLSVVGPLAHGEVTPGHVLDNVRFGTDNNPLRGRDIPGLAVDPADPRHIVMIDEDFLAGECDFHVTFDGGKTWKDGHLTVPSDFAQPPCRTFDSGGYAHYNKSVVFGSGQNVYTTFASHRGEQQRPESNVVAGEGDSVIVNQSTDGGRTWKQGVVAIEGAKSSRPFIIRPGVAVQPRPQGDRLYVVGWYVVNPPGMGASGGAGDRRAVVSVSEDGGATWSAPVDAQGPDEKVREIAPPVVGPDGAVYIAWRNRDDPATAPHPIVMAKSTDAGKTWTRTPVGDVGPAPTNVPAPAGSSGYPRTAIDPKSGAIYVVYTGFNFGDLDAIFQRSTDGGATWSPPVRLNDDPRGNGIRQLTPQVFVAPNGRVDAIWMDTRNTYPTPVVPRPAGQADLYYASSSDGGATFSSNRRITDRTINLDEGLLGRIGTYTWWGPAEAPIGNDAILFAWGDPRFGNVDNDTNDIMLATLQLGEAGPAAITELPRSTPANLSVAASQLAYPGGAERIGSAFTTKLVVVDKGDVAGAWAGAVLARANTSPLLITDGKLTKDQKKEIARIHPTGLFVVGDEKAVSQKLVDEIKRAGVNTAPPATAPATTAAPTTTQTTNNAPASTAAPAATTTTLAATSTVGRNDVIRLTGANPAEVAKSVAAAIDVRTDQERSRNVPAFNAAVAVNPNSREAAAGIAFAAALRYPVLYVERDGVPAATADAFNAAAIQNTFVVGGPESVSDAAMTRLPSAKRLGGAGLSATNAAVVNELTSRGLPVNVAFVVDDARPVDAAVAAAAVARTGGFLLLTPGADSGAAESRINQLGLGDQVDRIVVAESTTSSNVPWAVIVVSALLAVAGIVLLQRAATKKRARGPEAPAAAPAAAPATGDAQPERQP